MTSKQRPPVNNGHYFWVPMVVVVNRFDCIILTIQNFNIFYIKYFFLLSLVANLQTFNLQTGLFKLVNFFGLFMKTTKLPKIARNPVFTMKKMAEVAPRKKKFKKFVYDNYWLK